VALRTIMSREGLVVPPAKPANANKGSSSVAETDWVAIGKVSAPAASRPIAATRSWRRT
jgi:hypothetical protein